MGENTQERIDELRQRREDMLAQLIGELKEALKEVRREGREDLAHLSRRVDDIGHQVADLAKTVSHMEGALSAEQRHNATKADVAGVQGRNKMVDVILNQGMGFLVALLMAALAFALFNNGG